MIVVDVETSGVNAKKHSIVSLGAIDFFNPSNTFYEECRIWDGAHIMNEAHGDMKPVQEINGLSPEQMMDPQKQTVGELIQHFKEWTTTCKDVVFAGHNPSFDVEFITDSIDRFNIEWSLPRRTIDQHSICYAHMLAHGVEPPQRNGKSFLNSDIVMEYVGIPTEPKPHIALNGALWEAEALSRLIFGRNLLEQFKKYPVPDFKGQK